MPVMYGNVRGIGAGQADLVTAGPKFPVNQESPQIILRSYIYMLIVIRNVILQLHVYTILIKQLHYCNYINGLLI